MFSDLEPTKPLAGLVASMVLQKWLFLEILGVTFVGALIVKALQFGVHIRPPHF